MINYTKLVRTFTIISCIIPVFRCAIWHASNFGAVGHWIKIFGLAALKSVELLCFERTIVLCD